MLYGSLIAPTAKVRVSLDRDTLFILYVRVCVCGAVLCTQPASRFLAVANFVPVETLRTMPYVRGRYPWWYLFITVGMKGKRVRFTLSRAWFPCCCAKPSRRDPVSPG